MQKRNRPSVDAEIAERETTLGIGATWDNKFVQAQALNNTAFVTILGLCSYYHPVVHPPHPRWLKKTPQFDCVAL